MKEDLLKMADRVEALSGPDRAVDWELHVFDGPVGVGMYGAHPRYTASLDAAMTLYPVIPDRVPSNPRIAAAEALRALAGGE